MFNIVKKTSLTISFLINNHCKLMRRVTSLKIGAEICVLKVTDGILCFHCRTKCSTFSNVENGLWMLMSQLSARRNRSMTKIVVFVLIRHESYWRKLMVSPKSNGRSLSDADINNEQSFIPKKWAWQTNSPAVFQRSDLWTNKQRVLKFNLTNDSWTYNWFKYIYTFFVNAY